MSSRDFCVGDVVRVLRGKRKNTAGIIDELRIQAGNAKVNFFLAGVRSSQTYRLDNLVVIHRQPESRDD